MKYLRILPIFLVGTADFAAFFLQGELSEYAANKTLFTNPENQKTEAYVEGRFG